MLVVDIQVNILRIKNVDIQFINSVLSELIPQEIVGSLKYQEYSYTFTFQI